ncbi:MAG TPA: hypothetical protein VFU02_07590 [Polyangiaceae bacterium]|nr:hypothetical protein [Polyangiaceae bacterium]
MRAARYLAFAALCGLVACEDDVDSSDAPPDPAGLFWDNEWTFEGTYVKTGADTTLPLPTDLPLLERIRYGEGGAPPTSDVMEGARVIFEIDGRVLVQPAGTDAPEYFWTDYKVLDEQTLRASIRKSIWFPYDYTFDEPSETLLIQPDKEAGSAVMGLLLDIIEKTLFSGALDSAAARITELLFEDPRVSEAIDAFLYDLIHGAVADIPVQAPADVVAWLIELLKQSGIVPPEVPDTVLEAVLTPIVEELLPLDREGISRALVDRILESDLVTAITPDRVERVLTFVLYRRVLERGQTLDSIEQLDIVLERLPPPQD